ncbi:MAG: TRAP transporter small permease subunit [Rhodovibrionaceae bacterium]|nr:TRAP transporter small permease subunit [Rhodovibrionaceae bacterium]
MHALLRLSDVLSGIVSWVGRIAAWIAIPLMVIILIDVTGRKIIDIYPDFTNTVFYLGSTKLQEMEWHLHAILFLLCLGFAYVRDSHVRIELVRDRMNPKFRVWMELLGCLAFLIPYCIVVIDFGYDFALRAFKSGEVSSALTGLSHRWIIKSFMPVGFTILAVAGISVALRCIVYLFGPPELKAASGYYAGTHHADGGERVAVRHAEKDSNGN